MEYLVVKICYMRKKKKFSLEGLYKIFLKDNLI